MTRAKARFTLSAEIIRASARRILREHGAKAQAFAGERLKAASEDCEIETWRAIMAALVVICANERVR